eukprot:XP_001693562.1 predicted protein [Chlamydomonas reinhardtii]
MLSVEPEFSPSADATKPEVATVPSAEPYAPDSPAFDLEAEQQRLLFELSQALSGVAHEAAVEVAVPRLLRRLGACLALGADTSALTLRLYGIAPAAPVARIRATDSADGDVLTAAADVSSAVRDDCRRLLGKVAAPQLARLLLHSTLAADLALLSRAVPGTYPDDSRRLRARRALLRNAMELAVLKTLCNHANLVQSVYLVVLEVALALRHMHSRRVVHRDVKPGNVLVKGCAGDPRGWTCKLADFGLPTHMPPECFIKGARITAAVDIFALGITMWELTSGGGQRPHRHLEAAAIPRAVVRGLRPSFPNDGSVPDSFKRLASACWAADPAQRPRAYLMRGLSSGGGFSVFPYDDFTR